MAETTFTYDLRGLKCPLVLLKTRKKKAELSPEIKLVIVSDDPLTSLDIANYCQKKITLLKNILKTAFITFRSHRQNRCNRNAVMVIDEQPDAIFT